MRHIIGNWHRAVKNLAPALATNHQNRLGILNKIKNLIIHSTLFSLLLIFFGHNIIISVYL